VLSIKVLHPGRSPQGGVAGAAPQADLVFISSDVRLAITPRHKIATDATWGSLSHQPLEPKWITYIYTYVHLSDWIGDDADIVHKFGIVGLELILGF
jgi:hypothetical protein